MRRRNVVKAAQGSAPEDAISRDDILTDVSVYWFTGTAGSAANIYYESTHGGDFPVPSGVPTGVAVFAEDIAIRRYGEQVNNIVHWTDFETGGHFAALETPGLLVKDVRAFFAGLPVSRDRILRGPGRPDPGTATSETVARPARYHLAGRAVRRAAPGPLRCGPPLWSAALVTRRPGWWRGSPAGWEIRVGSGFRSGCRSGSASGSTTGTGAG
jgi:hypothetical protein